MRMTLLNPQPVQQRARIAHQPTCAWLSIPQVISAIVALHCIPCSAQSFGAPQHTGEKAVQGAAMRAVDELLDDAGSICLSGHVLPEDADSI